MTIEQKLDVEVLPQAVFEEQLVLNHKIHEFMAEAGMVAQIYDVHTPRTSYYDAREIRSFYTRKRMP